MQTPPATAGRTRTPEAGAEAALPLTRMRSSLRPPQPRALPDRNAIPLTPRTGRAKKPNTKGRDRQALPLRQVRPAPAAPQRLRRLLQLRPQAQDPQRPRFIGTNLFCLLKSRQLHEMSRATDCCEKTWPIRDRRIEHRQSVGSTRGASQDSRVESILASPRLTFGRLVGSPKA